MEAIEKEKRRYRGQNFTELKSEDVQRKLKRLKSPFISSRHGVIGASGGNNPLHVGIWNPDPSQAIWLFAHAWVGFGNVDPVVGTFLLNVDTCFPRLTEPAFFGASINPSSSLDDQFRAWRCRRERKKTNYLGNTCLMEFNWHDVGVYLDRGVWPFTVT